MKLHVLSLGECDVDKGALLTPGIDDGRRVRIPVPAYLIETDDGERVLIDTGMHPVHIDDPLHTFRDKPEVARIITPVMRPADLLERRLAEVGMGIADITMVVNSHLHFDHCGANSAFPDVPIVVQREHYDVARSAPGFPSEYFDLPWLRYQLIDGEHEIATGVHTLVTPGHVRGHQSFLVDLPRSGRMLLCIDAVYTHDNIRWDAWGSQEEPDQARATARRLTRIADRERAVLVYGHDPEQWRTLKHPPDHYT